MWTTEDRRFSSTIICNGIGEFQYIKIKDKKYSDNHLTYHISSNNDLDYLLNSLNENIVDLKNKRKSLWCKIKERIIGCNNG